MKSEKEFRKPNLPEIPEGYRWVILDTGDDDEIGVRLEELKTITSWWSGKAKAKWMRVDGERAIRERDYYHARTETVVESVERVAKKIRDDHVERLEKSLEREIVIGIYESGKD